MRFQLTEWLWVLREPQVDRSEVVLLLPYAAGSAYSLDDWVDQVPEDAVVIGAQYPGRGPRVDEPAAESLQVIADAISADLLRLFPNAPAVVIGHSMGAIIAFELASRLEAVDHPVRHLICSSARPASARRLDPEPLHEYPTSELLAALRQRGGLPDEALEASDLLEMLEPVVRADFRMLFNYTFSANGHRLRAPILALGGREDPVVSRSDLAAWATLTDGEFDLQMFSGGHFFYRHHMSEIGALARERIER